MDYSNKIIGNRYQLIKPLGRGGMGAVYLARHVAIGRELAIKLLHTELTSNKDVVKRFFREAQAAAQIKHRGIIDVFDMGIAEWGEPYLAMEYLKGESLNNTLSRLECLDLPAVLGIAEPLLLALSSTHRKGIVHRDIKPSNIFIAVSPDAPPSVKLIDFGISKIRSAKSSITQTGTLLGTLDYMAPEQLRGDSDISGAADLWAIGVVVYEMLTGYLPFSGENINARYLNILTKEPVPPKSVLPSCPDEIEAFILKTLRREPGDRFATADEMMDALKAMPDFGEREAALAALAKGIKDPTSAVDDLGSSEVVADSDHVVKEMMQQVIMEATPSANLPLNTLPTHSESSSSMPTRGTTEPTPDRWTGSATVAARQSRSVAVWVLIGLATAALLLVVFLIVEKKQQPEVVKVPVSLPEKKSAPPAPADKAASPSAMVTISVTGAPENARFFFNEEKMAGSIFLRKRSETPGTLKIDAPGYRSYIATVLPTGDTIIDVQLESIEEIEKSEAPKRRRSHRAPNHRTDKKADATGPLDQSSSKSSPTGSPAKGTPPGVFVEEFE
jgi:serine/threonine protein kinase